MVLVIRKFRRFIGKGRLKYIKRYLTKGESSKEKENEKENGYSRA